jgi:hypothetical protein
MYYVRDVEIDRALVQSWCYLKCIPGKYWYEVGVTSCYYQAGIRTNLVLPQVVLDLSAL